MGNVTVSDENENVDNILDDEPIVEADAEIVDADGAVVDEADPSADPSNEEEPVVLTVEDQLEQAQALAEEHRNNWLRTLADVENQKKRLKKLETDMYTNARVNIGTELLPVLDDFNLAMQSVPETIAADDWYKGLELVPRKLAAVIEKIGLKKIDSVGHEFDPSLHQAIQSVESDEFESGTVIKEFQAGYEIHGRIVRPAIVVVAA